MNNQTARVVIHHREQFGEVPIERIGLKLAEEVGELSSAIIRDLERRDDRSWRPQIESELMDCLVVLHVIAGRYGWNLEGLSEDAVYRFEGRKWSVTKPEETNA